MQKEASILDSINGKRDGFLIQNFCNDHTHERQQSHSESQQQLDTLEADINTLLSLPINEKVNMFYDEDIRDQTRALLESTKPWVSDPNYFQHAHVSALALLKMSIHARSGGDIEIMGMLTGNIVKNGIVVMDVYPLPVEGTETRVNAQAEGYEFMVQYKDSLKKAGRNENIVGWYHSHPGYGCWLSGIDVSTQSLNQQFQDPYLAIVIDPHRTLANGIVEIGAFRTYPQDHHSGNGNQTFGSLGSLVISPDPSKNRTAKAKQPKIEKKKKTDPNTIPEEKVKDFGLHSSKYYSLSIEIFRSEMDHLILQNLWNKFWIKGLLGELQTTQEKDSIESFIQDKLDAFHRKVINFGNAHPNDDSKLKLPMAGVRGTRRQRLALTTSLGSSPQTAFNLLSSGMNQSEMSPFTRANLLSKMGATIEKAKIENDGSDSEMNDADSDCDSRQDDDSEIASIAQRLDGQTASSRSFKESISGITTPKRSNDEDLKSTPERLSKLTGAAGESNLSNEERKAVLQAAAEAGRNLMTLKLQEILFLNE